MGSRWSITPEESHNLAAENYLALLNIQSKLYSLYTVLIYIKVSGGNNSSNSSSPLNEVSSLSSSLPSVSYVLTPTQDHA